MTKAIRSEIPLTVRGTELQAGTVFNWDDKKKAYVYKDKKTGSIIALLYEETADGLPDEFKKVDYE